MLKLTVDKDGDATLDLGRVTLDGRSSSCFSYEPVDGDFVLFEPEANHHMFYELIRELDVSKIPAGVQFEIYNINFEEITRPLELLPAPFNVLNFFKQEDRFYVRFSSMREEEGGPEWPDLFYLDELKAQCLLKGFSHINIKEQDGFRPFEGGFIVEVDAFKVNTPEEALHKALSSLHSLMEEVNAVIGDKAGMEELLDLWEKHAAIKDRNYWSKTLGAYPHILTQVLNSPLLVLEDSMHAGSTRIKAETKDIANYLRSHQTLDKIVLLEVMSPLDELTGAKHDGSYLISDAVNAHINLQLERRQVLLDGLAKEGFEDLKQEVECCIVIGKKEGMSDEELQVWRLYKQNLNHLEMVPFDEFIEKVKYLLDNYDQIRKTKVIRMRTA